MRIVHFSDIHLGCWTRDVSALIDKRLLGQLNYFLRRRPVLRYELIERAAHRIRALSPDWIVCTGDITCVGSPEEFGRALQQLSILTDSAPHTFLFVPGNHDAYVRNTACRDSLEDAFARLNGGTCGLRGEPREVEAGRLRFLLANEAEPVSCILSSGGLSIEGRDALRHRLEAPRMEGEKRILVGHFPLRDALGRRLGRRRRLRDADWLYQCFEAAQFDVSLCGHVHTPFVRWESSGCVEICAGSLTAHGIFSVLDYSPMTGRFSQFWEDVSNRDPIPLDVPRELALAGAID